ncbi:MAG: hydrogenase maturation nickel metallochaperone HypA [Actinobacteria bacterium]|jgi:hydrogenase nickel incorporation protein HypA/HybF|nr:hydrogenase maturation nickel metallochaperone HypA [Actinomycetota bacterium]
MHELSVAHAVVSTVIGALPSPDTRVLQVRLRIGELSGLVPQALEFAYDVAAQGTPLADAALVIERSPIVVDCPTCGRQELASARDFRCPACSVPCGNVVGGKELEIIDITLDDVLVGGGVA